MPSLVQDRIDLELLELQGNEELGRTVEDRVGCNEEALLWIDSEEERYVQSVRILLIFFLSVIL